MNNVDLRTESTLFTFLQNRIHKRLACKGLTKYSRKIYSLTFPTGIFFYTIFSKNSFRNTIRVSNRLDPDQAQHFVGPDLGTNCCKSYQQTTLGDKELTYLYPFLGQ